MEHARRFAYLTSICRIRRGLSFCRIIEVVLTFVNARRHVNLFLDQQLERGEAEKTNLDGSNTLGGAEERI